MRSSQTNNSPHNINHIGTIHVHNHHYPSSSSNPMPLIGQSDNAGLLPPAYPNTSAGSSSQVPIINNVLLSNYGELNVIDTINIFHQKDDYGIIDSEDKLLLPSKNNDPNTKKIKSKKSILDLKNILDIIKNIPAFSGEKFNTVPVDHGPEIITPRASSPLLPTSDGFEHSDTKKSDKKNVKTF